MRELRQAVGLRSLSQGPAQADRRATASKAGLPALKQYRHDDGKFYFKLIDSDGQLLLQSLAFDSPRQAGELVAHLKQGDSTILERYADRFEPPLDAQKLAQALLLLRQASETAGH
jgi:tryptophanyl-tRNA synthetase